MRKIYISLFLLVILLVSCGSTSNQTSSPWKTNTDGIRYMTTYIEGMPCIYLQWGQSISCNWDRWTGGK